MSKIPGDEPIQPIYAASGSPLSTNDDPYINGAKIYKGLTIRQHFAAMNMQALISFYGYKSDLAALASKSVIGADALIAELNKTTNHD